MSNSEVQRKALEDLRRKTNMFASVHGIIADRYSAWFAWLRYSTLFFSSMLLALTFVSEDFVTRTLPLSLDQFKWLRAAASVLNFYAGLILLIWRPADLESRHRTAVTHYGRVQYEIRTLEEKGNGITEQDVYEIRERYLDNSHLPYISDRVFLSMKRQHLIKVSISRFLDQHPHSWIWLVRLRLWWKDTIAGPSSKGSVVQPDERTTFGVISIEGMLRGGHPVGEVRIKRLDPIHDPEAYERVMRILGNGLRRGLIRLRQQGSQSDVVLGQQIEPTKR